MKKLTIGTLQSNDIVIQNDTTVSRSHAFLFTDSNNNIYISDCNSLNGTFVNGLKVDDAILNDLDILKVGNTVIDWLIHFRPDISYKNNEINKIPLNEKNDFHENSLNNLKGQTSNSELISNAWNELNGQWGLAIGFFVLYVLLTLVSSFLGPFVTCALLIGSSRFWLNIADRNNPEINDLFVGFKSYPAALGSYLLFAVIILGGYFLLILPAIYWACSYCMTSYIIAENPKVGGNESLVLSRKMMNGHKWKFFRFYLRIILILLISYIPLGLGLFIGVPLIMVSLAKFYNDIK